MTLKWQRIEDGYQAGKAQIFDNGAGLGPAKDGGRWSLLIDGEWVATVDFLAEAKERAERELAEARS